MLHPTCNSSANTASCFFKSPWIFLTISSKSTLIDASDCNPIFHLVTHLTGLLSPIYLKDVTCLSSSQNLPMVSNFPIMTIKALSLEPLWYIFLFSLWPHLNYSPFIPSTLGILTSFLSLISQVSMLRSLHLLFCSLHLEYYKSLPNMIFSVKIFQLFSIELLLPYFSDLIYCHSYCCLTYSILI